MPVIVTLDPSIDLATARQGLTDLHFHVESVLEGLHVVSGEADAAALAQVRALPYVIGVEADEMVHLDPREVPKMGRDFRERSAPAATPPVTGASWRSPAWDSDAG